MNGYGLDFEVWFHYGKFDRDKLAVFVFRHHAEEYILSRGNFREFSIFDRRIQRELVLVNDSEFDYRWET